MPRDSGEPPRASMPSSVLGTTPEVAAPVAVTALRAGDVEAARPVPVASFAPGEQGAQRSPRASASEAEGRAAADLPRPPAERDRPSVAERTPAAAERPAVHIGQIEVRVDAPAPPSATSVPPVSPAGFDDYVDLRSFG